MIIDCAVVSPGNGNDVVDGLNEVDKNILKLMFRIVCPERKHIENHMNAQQKLQMVQQVFHWSLKI